MFRRCISRSFFSLQFQRFASSNINNITINRADLPRLKVTTKDLQQNKKSSSSPNGSGTLDPDNCPPSLKEIRLYMNKYPGKVVMTELGKFYELYFENADDYGPKLNLKVTKRNYAAAKISMAGFPTQYCYKYIDQLINVHNVGVVLIKQYLKNPLSTSNVKKFTRRVHRIITPGTVIEEDMLDNERNNFILSIHFPKDFNSNHSVDYKVGLCWCDISTTEFFVQESSLSSLMNDLYRIRPTEIIINDLFKVKLTDHLNLIFLTQCNINWVQGSVDKVYNPSKYFQMFNERNPEKFADCFARLSRSERNSAFLLLDYIKQQFEINEAEEDQEKEEETAIIEEFGIQESSFNFSLPVRNKLENFMLIDSSAREALEITETIKDRSKKNTLYNTVKRTITPSGARLLRSWLNSPPYDLKESKRRLNFVKIFAHGSFSMHKHRIQESLKNLANFDPMRLLFSISFNSNAINGSVAGSDNPNIRLGWNYLCLLKVLNNFLFIKRTLSDFKGTKSFTESLENFNQELSIPKDLVTKIEKLINRDNLEKLHETINDIEEGSNDDEQPIGNINELFNSMKKSSFPDMTWIINIANIDEKDSQLVKNHKLLQELLMNKKKLEQKMAKVADKLQLKTLELRIDNDLPNIYIQYPVKLNLTSSILQETFEITNTFKQSKTSRNFTTAEWNELGYKISKTIRKIRLEELKFFKILRLDVLFVFEEIKSTAFSIDYLDVLISFANLSKEFNLVHPTLNKKIEINIERGRHITVENNLRNNVVEFQPNDCALSLDSDIGYIISGPNMGGKSTYLRQNAIIVILAHVGCFVPASSATIGLVDKIFTRIGAADDITNNSSTFMTEMTETSHGLNHATKRSLLIFDEIGRGTSNNEGIAVAYGILKYMVTKLKSRFLFATHYAPELNYLISINDKDNSDFCMNDKISYYHTTLMSELLNKYLEKKASNVISSNIFNGRFFDHRLVPGISEYSHATSIASLANIPEDVVEDAKIAINIMKSRGNEKTASNYKTN
ncbi:mismatch repair ATPase [Saccharomycopsis crataegensis]|uniref:Mismatch repair ATPase n=1 Tax=Saccharomycopsis crataegensis TaxID=43959 RepID=A0AAV5QIW4_9ASCO|nr:mismatch repair ATPase [Saccharomycopsis crataegensis]